MSPHEFVDAVFSHPEILAQPGFWLILSLFGLVFAGIIRWSHKHDYRQLVATRDENQALREEAQTLRQRVSELESLPDSSSGSIAPRAITISPTITAGADREPSYSKHYVHLDEYLFGHLAFLLNDTNPGKALNEENQAILRRLKSDARQHRFVAAVDARSQTYGMDSRVGFAQLRKYLLTTDFDSHFQRELLERGRQEDQQVHEERERN